MGIVQSDDVTYVHGDLNKAYNYAQNVSCYNLLFASPDFERKCVVVGPSPEVGRHPPPCTKSALSLFVHLFDKGYVLHV